MLQITRIKKHPVWIGDNLLKGSLASLNFDKDYSKNAILLLDRRLKAVAHVLAKSLRKAGWIVHFIPVHASEELKELNAIYPIYEKLLSLKADRRSVLFAIGGGVIGDVAGFIAGTYLRGIPWVGVPTTLLAQVDSSVGGKTGVNHKSGKNLIGIFNQPSYVLCDTSVLKTLSPRDRLSGWGEMIKYGLIADRSFYLELVRRWEVESLDVDARLIHRCLDWKAKFVVRDPFDLTGVREVLNFGHTIGHALEAELGYGYLRHGEAVIWGMRAALYLSVLRGHLSKQVQQGVDHFLSQLPVPVIHSVKISQLMKRFKTDKKMRPGVNGKPGKVRFVLLKAVGKTVLDSQVEDSEVFETARWLMQQSQVKK